jgi:NAD(P)-dependent dehydrogenase (short-subunit alcohol dehydrogenase family)
MPAPRLGDMRAMARGEGAAGDSRAASGRRRYTTSKLCNVLCAYEMSRRIAARAGAPRATVNAFDPGLMPGTSLARDYRPIERFAWSYLLPVLTLFMKNVNTVWTSGRRLAELALDPAYEGVTGRYFSRGREAPSSTESHDLEKARELWELSSELVGQEPSETWPSA